MAALDHDFVANELSKLVALLTLPLTALAAIAGFGTLAPAIFVIGYFLLVPVLGSYGDELADALLGPREADAAGTTDSGRSQHTEDPLEELKRRYASGEIGEREFERQTERLLALDDVDASDAAEAVLASEAATAVDGRDAGVRKSNATAASDREERDERETNVRDAGAERDGGGEAEHTAAEPERES